MTFQFLSLELIGERKVKKLKNNEVLNHVIRINDMKLYQFIHES